MPQHHPETFHTVLIPGSKLHIFPAGKPKAGCSRKGTGGELTRSPSSRLLPTFLVGRVPLLNRLQKKGYPYSNLSTGGPSFLQSQVFRFFTSSSPAILFSYTKIGFVQLSKSGFVHRTGAQPGDLLGLLHAFNSLWL